MKFKIGGKELLFRGKWIELWSTEFVDGAGKKQKWEWIKKHDPVLVFPITPDNKVVLIKSYRVPLEQYVIETPAGLNDRGETLEEVAMRELFEETGYKAAKLTPLPDWPYSSATSNGIIHAFIATELEKVGEQKGDDVEDIEIIEVPLDKLQDFCFNLPRQTLFLPNILAMYEMAKMLKVCS